MKYFEEYSYIGVICEIITPGNSAGQMPMYKVDYFKKVMINSQEYFQFNATDQDDIGHEYIVCVLDDPEIVTKKDQVYYKFDYAKHNISVR